MLGAAVALSLGACPIEETPLPITMRSDVIVDERGVVPPLVCPGAIGCERGATGPLVVGAAARPITPVVDEGAPPVWIAGFGIGRQATGVHDDVWVRALVLTQGDVNVGLVVVDAVGVFHHDVVRIRREAAPLGLDQIIVTSTHVHESKDTMGMWGEAVGQTGYDELYMQLIAREAALALGEAVDGARPARMTVGVAVDDGDVAAFVRDSRLPDVRDPGVYALQFDAVDDGAPIATFVTWGNHPEALGSDNTLITSDYPHYLRAEIEARIPGTVALFTPGILGGLTTPIGVLVCPAADGVSEECPQGTFERAERIGRVVGGAAVDALTNASAEQRDLAAPALSVKRLPLMLTPTSQPLAIAFQLGMLDRPAFDAATGEPIPREQLAGMSIDDIALGLVQIDSEVSVLSIGDVDLLTVPGELYAELWVNDGAGGTLIEHPEGADFPDAPAQTPLRTLLGGETRLVLNNGNDAIGYIIPEAQFDFVEPYAYDPVEGQYGEVNSIGHHAAAEVADAVAALVELTAR